MLKIGWCQGDTKLLQWLLTWSVWFNMVLKNQHFHNKMQKRNKLNPQKYNGTDHNRFTRWHTNHTLRSPTRNYMPYASFSSVSPLFAPTKWRVSSKHATDRPYQITTMTQFHQWIHANFGLTDWIYKSWRTWDNLYQSLNNIYVSTSIYVSMKII